MLSAHRCMCNFKRGYGGTFLRHVHSSLFSAPVNNVKKRTTLGPCSCCVKCDSCEVSDSISSIVIESEYTKPVTQLHWG